MKKIIIIIPFLLFQLAAYCQNSFSGDSFAEISDFDRRYYTNYQVTVKNDTLAIFLIDSTVIIRQYNEHGHERVLTIKEAQGLIYLNKVKRPNIKLLRRNGRLYAVKIREGEKSFYFFAKKEEL